MLHTEASVLLRGAYKQARHLLRSGRPADALPLLEFLHNAYAIPPLSGGGAGGGPASPVTPTPAAAAALFSASSTPSPVATLRIPYPTGDPNQHFHFAAASGDGEVPSSGAAASQGVNTVGNNAMPAFVLTHDHLHSDYNTAVFPVSWCGLQVLRIEALSALHRCEACLTTFRLAAATVDRCSNGLGRLPAAAYRPALQSAIALREWSRASSLAKALLELDPNCAAAYVALGRIAAHARRPEEAGDYYQEALRCDPFCASAFELLADGWHVTPRRLEAFVWGLDFACDLGAGTEDDGDANTSAFPGAHDPNSTPPEAIGFASDGGRRRPRSGEYTSSVVGGGRSLSDRGAATVDAEVDAAARALSGEACRAAYLCRIPAAASRPTPGAMRLVPAQLQYYQRALEFMEASQPAAACKETTAALAAGPPTKHVVCTHIAALCALRDAVAMFRFTHTLVEVYPAAPVSFYAAAAYQFHFASVERAARLAGRAVDLDPEFAEAAVMMAHCYAALEEDERALEEYRRVAQAFPGLMQCRFFIGAQYARCNSLASALTLSRECLEDADLTAIDDAHAANEARAAFLETPHAMQHRMLLMGPDMTSAGKDATLVGDMTAAEQSFVMERLPVWHALTLNELARHALRAGDVEHSRDLLERARVALPQAGATGGAADGVVVKGFSPLLEIHLNLGAVLRLLGDFDGAAAAYEEYLVHRPHDRSALTALGLTRHIQGRLDAAIPCYQSAIALHPDAVAHELLERAFQELHGAPGRATYRADVDGPIAGRGGGVGVGTDAWLAGRVSAASAVDTATVEDPSAIGVPFGRSTSTAGTGGPVSGATSFLFPTVGGGHSHMHSGGAAPAAASSHHVGVPHPNAFPPGLHFPHLPASLQARSSGPSPMPFAVGAAVPPSIVPPSVPSAVTPFGISADPRMPSPGSVAAVAAAAAAAAAGGAAVSGGGGGMSSYMGPLHAPLPSQQQPHHHVLPSHHHPSVSRLPVHLSVPQSHHHQGTLGVGGIHHSAARPQTSARVLEWIASAAMSSRPASVSFERGPSAGGVASAAGAGVAAAPDHSAAGQQQNYSSLPHHHHHDGGAVLPVHHSAWSGASTAQTRADQIAPAGGFWGSAGPPAPTRHRSTTSAASSHHTGASSTAYYSLPGAGATAAFGAGLHLSVPSSRAQFRPSATGGADLSAALATAGGGGTSGVPLLSAPPPVAAALSFLSADDADSAAATTAGGVPRVSWEGIGGVSSGVRPTMTGGIAPRRSDATASRALEFDSADGGRLTTE